MNWSDLSMSQRSDLMQIYLKNGITSLEDMKKHYNSFAEGGNTEIPPERFFGIATPEVTDNTVYQPTYGTLLPEIKVNAERLSWQHNLTDYDVARLKSGQISSETAKSIAQKRATGISGYMKDVNKLAWLPNSAMALAGGLSGVLANPYLWGAIGLGSAAQNIENKNYGEAALDVGLTFLGPELRLLNKGVEATRFGKSARIASELNKAVKSTRLQPKVVENPVHTRFRLGDVELNAPNLMYHVDNGDFTGFSGNGAYVKDSMLYPTRGNEMQEPYSWWNLGSPYRTGQSRLLTTTKDNPNFIKVRDQNYPIGQWDGNKGFVTNSEYVSSNPIKIGNQYVWEPGYGYRRYSNNPSTLPLKDVLDTKISLTHVYPREYLEPLVSSKHKSLIIPSTADNPIGWRDDPILFLDNSILKKYPHQSYLGDGETNTVNGVWGKRSKNLTDYSIEELQNHIDANIGLIKTSYLPEKSHPATDDEVLFNSRLRRYTELNNPEMYKGADTYDEVHFHSPIPIKHVKYAFVPNKADLSYFDGLGIKTNFDFSGDEGYDLQKFREWILNNGNEIAFKDGGHIHIKPENRGKFTALKKRTGHSASWFKENGTPAQKKMAVFALNAKKWSKK